MKSFYLVVAAALMVVMAGGAWATDTSDLIVTANVSDTCTTITDGTPVAIALDPMAGGAVTNGGVAVQPNIKCTMGSTHAVSCSSLNTNNLKNGANLIPYMYNAGSVCGTNITGNGSTPVNLTMGIDIANGAYSDSPAGAYSDTITITVTY
ncbi:MAG: hypothetical protein OEW15_01500 [Nitrospirota bacterium]|nr:hypothetical protein [Nitrospirota bacterium]